MLCPHIDACQLVFVEGLKNDSCHLSITLSITCAVLSATRSPISRASLKSSFTQTRVSHAAQSLLALLSSSHVSGVGTLWISLRRKLFPQDEQRIHLPPTLTLPSTLLPHAWPADVSLEEAWLTCQIRLAREAPAVRAAPRQGARPLDFPMANSSSRASHCQGQEHLSPIRA